MKNIHEDRIQELNDKKINSDGKYILYYPIKSFRAHWNHSLEYAVGLAENSNCGVLVLSTLQKVQKYLTERQVAFHLEGLKDFESELSDRNIKFVLQLGNLDSIKTSIFNDAIAVVTDFTYLNEDHSKLDELEKKVTQKLIKVESNVVVPVQSVSEKQEYAARTIRPKLMEKYEEYLEKPTSSEVPKSTLNMSFETEDLSNLEDIVEKLQFSDHTEVIKKYEGGFTAAKKKLDSFLRKELDSYEDSRQSPTDRSVSEMSPYLRFGHIAPSYIISRIKRQKSDENIESYIDEILVRRELAHNFVYFSKKDYDHLAALPDWANETLKKHKSDERAYVYTQKELEEAKTHDEAWNESMRRMKAEGYLHNHMRMYWGKCILAWTNTPAFALKTILYLNNKYFLDGNDPNSYANALWILVYMIGPGRRMTFLAR